MSGEMDRRQRIIVALDVDTVEDARDLVARLGADCSNYKVGLQLLTAVGPGIVRELVEADKQVFLDLKLHEIPNSVAAGVAAAGRLGATLVTVHASGGSAVLRAAAEAARPFPALRVLAVTVITSLQDADLPEVGVTGTVEVQVLRLARLAMQSGCYGVVCSPQELPALRRELGISPLLVTPGVQLPGDARTDQARVATPAEAFASGASYVVMGRAITKAADPRAALRSSAL
jgi:orotidine-5'-phosphate decarboxylase